ncbi:MAG: Sua5/YciO/YrdC/YwlC family protein [Gammaproteobacteria bacterium]|nr:Sua5/YciO/YrdC/YwlC family protein [Gammaproteobacteria bacterium]
MPDTTAPAWIRGQHETVALRVSAHPVIDAICREFNRPIVSTSANPSGKPPAKTALRLHQYFHGRIDHIVPGELGGAGGATEIRELRGGTLVRPG